MLTHLEAFIYFYMLVRFATQKARLKAIQSSMLSVWQKGNYHVNKDFWCKIFGLKLYNMYNWTSLLQIALHFYPCMWSMDMFVSLLNALDWYVIWAIYNLTMTAGRCFNPIHAQITSKYPAQQFVSTYFEEVHLLSTNSFASRLFLGLRHLVAPLMLGL